MNSKVSIRQTDLLPHASQDVQVCTENIGAFVQQVKAMTRQMKNPFPLIAAAFDGEYPSQSPISAAERQPTYLLLLRVLLRRGQLEPALQMHRHLLDQGFIPPLDAYALLLKYVCNGKRALPDPQFVEPIWTQLWHGPSRIVHLNDNIFHALLCTLYKMKQFSAVNKELESYIQEHRRPDHMIPNFTYALAIRAAFADGDVDTAHKWFDDYRTSRFERPPTLLTGEKPPAPFYPHHTDAAVYTTFMAGYAQVSPDDLTPVLAAAAQMSEDGVPFTLEAYHQLIAGSRRKGDVRGAFDLYTQLRATRQTADGMVAASLVPDSYIFASLFRGLEAWKNGHVIKDQRRDQYTPPVDARELFRHMTEAHRSSSVPVIQPDMLDVALRYFLRYRDYAAALVVLHTIERYPRGKQVCYPQIRDTVLGAFERRIAGELIPPAPLRLLRQSHGDMGPRSESDNVVSESREVVGAYHRTLANALADRRAQIEARSRWTRMMLGKSFRLKASRPREAGHDGSQQLWSETLIHLGEREQEEYPLVDNVWGVRRKQRQQYTREEHEASIHPLDECPVAPDFPSYEEDDPHFRSMLHSDSLLPFASTNFNSLGHLPAMLRSLGLASPIPLQTLIAITQRALVAQLGLWREPENWGRGQEALEREVKQAAREMVVRLWEWDQGVKVDKGGRVVAASEEGGMELDGSEEVPASEGDRSMKEIGVVWNGIEEARHADRRRRRVCLGYLPRYTELEESATITF